jgi:hypothetical protein
MEASVIETATTNRSAKDLEVFLELADMNDSLGNLCTPRPPEEGSVRLIVES